MPRIKRLRWCVRLSDCSFFSYTHRGCWVNAISCSTLTAALKHVRRNTALGNTVILEHSRRITNRSPKPHGLYRVKEYIYQPTSDHHFLETTND